MDWNKHLGLRPEEALLPLGDGLHGRVLQVLPERAANWWKYNTENRPCSDGHVESLLADLHDNHFYLTHEAIAFYENGPLADGQHRLKMIMEGNQPVDILVVCGVPSKAKLAINDGRKRTDIDVAVLANEVPDGVEKRDFQRHIEIAKSMLYYPHKSEDYSVKQRRIAFTKRHLDAICFANAAFSNPTSKSLAQATIVAVAARAYYHYDRSVVKDFGHKVAVGANCSEDDPALIFRNYILKLSNRNAGNERRLLHMIATDAFLAHADGTPLKIPSAASIKTYKRKWEDTKDNVFPLPGERVLATA